MHLRAVVLIRSERMVLLPCESYCLSIETRSGTGSCYAGQSKIKQPNKRGRFALRESGSFRAERPSKQRDNGSMSARCKTPQARTPTTGTMRTMRTNKRRGAHSSPDLDV